MIDAGLSAPEYRPRIFDRLKGWPVASLCLGLIAALAAYFALRSFMFAMTDVSALPIGDIYYFYYDDYFPYLDGHYSFRQLFASHNEHPILTTRLTLFVDAIWFGASGKFAIIVSFLLIFVTSLMMAYLTTTSNKWETAGLALAFLGLGCSAVQLENLTLPFQAQMFFVHAFALAALIALWHGLEGRRWWYAVAVACDFGAAFSLGSGVLLVFPALALAVWARRFDRWFAVFLACHLLFISFYVSMGGPGGTTVSSSAAPHVDYFLTFLANFVAERPIPAAPIGAIIALLCAGLFSWMTWRALFRGIRWNKEAVIAAFAAFVILQAAVASVTRAHLGVHQALSSKYATFSLLLVAALFAFVWRAIPQAWSRVTAALVLGAVLVTANSPLFENGWRAHNRHMDAILAEMKNGNLSAEAAYLGVPPQILEAVISRFRESHLGPFRQAN